MPTAAVKTLTPHPLDSIAHLPFPDKLADLLLTERKAKTALFNIEAKRGKVERDIADLRRKEAALDAELGSLAQRRLAAEAEGKTDGDGVARARATETQKNGILAQISRLEGEQRTRAEHLEAMRLDIHGITLRVQQARKDYKHQAVQALRREAGHEFREKLVNAMGLMAALGQPSDRIPFLQNNFGITPELVRAAARRFEALLEQSFNAAADVKEQTHD